MALELIRVRFQGSGAFQNTLKRRVDEYFQGLNVSRRDAPRMYAKTALILAVAVGSYGLLMFTAVAWWQAVILAIALALGMAGIGFSVQHDANHGGYSRNRWINYLMSISLDMIGGSSFIWYWKHNIVHHTYTNISGVDVDIELEPLLRLAPDQRWRWYHRFQQFYIWILYAILPFNWQFWADYRDLANGHISGVRFPRPTKRVLAGTLAGKGFFYGWSLVLPLVFHPTWAVLGFYLIVSSVLGIVLTTTFQLAHCVDETECVTVGRGAGPLAVGWAEHQVRTTANFAPGNGFLTWYLGGLNYQIEHHLFPKVCHVHYPALSPIVSATCREFGIPYQSHRTVRAAVASHFRWLRRLGHGSVVCPVDKAGLVEAPAHRAEKPAEDRMAGPWSGHCSGGPRRAPS
jgi:linoleoyl-CoA desaturase